MVILLFLFDVVFVWAINTLRKRNPFNIFSLNLVIQRRTSPEPVLGVLLFILFLTQNFFFTLSFFFLFSMLFPSPPPLPPPPQLSEHISTKIHVALLM